jgi:hypothetical protein
MWMYLSPDEFNMKLKTFLEKPFLRDRSNSLMSTTVSTSYSINRAMKLSISMPSYPTVYSFI